MARMCISAKNLRDAIVIRPRPLSVMTAQVVMEAVMAAMNSNEGILMTDKFQIDIAQFKRGSGGGQVLVNIEKDCKAKRSIITETIFP